MSPPRAPSPYGNGLNPPQAQPNNQNPKIIVIKVGDDNKNKDKNGDSSSDSNSHKQVPQKRKLEGEANFTFIFLENIKLDTDFGDFKVLTLKTKYLEDVHLQFDEIVKKDNSTRMIVVANKKLVRASTSLNSRKIQALIGYAVSKNYLKFKSAYEKDPNQTFSLSLKDRPMLSTNFQVIAMDLHCVKDIQAKV